MCKHSMMKMYDAPFEMMVLSLVSMGADPKFIKLRICSAVILHAVSGNASNNASLEKNVIYPTIPMSFPLQDIS